MKITYIFTATGRYSIFIPKLVESGLKNFLPDEDVDFITFTDSDEYEHIQSKLRVIKHEKMGWPYDTLKRFHLLKSIEDKIDSDYIFYGNANMIFNQLVLKDEVFKSDPDMLAVIHPCFYNSPKNSFPYERNPESTAFVDFGEEGEHYYQGCFFGGKKIPFMKMISKLMVNVDKDLEKGIIAEWWDESHMNKFFIENPPQPLDSGFAYPENMNLPFDKKIIQLNKSNYGGHEFLRQ